MLRPSPLSILLDQISVGQAVLAERLGIDRRQVHHWLRNGCVPHARVGDVCDALGLDAAAAAAFYEANGTALASTLRPAPNSTIHAEGL